MQIKKIIRCQVVYILLVVLFVLAVIFNINTGNVHISPARIFRIIFLHGDMGTPEYNIIWKIRLPRLCMAGHCRYPDFYCRLFSEIRLQDRLCLVFRPVQRCLLQSR